MNTMGCASLILGIFKLKPFWHLSQPFTNGNSENSLIWSVMKIGYLLAAVLIHDFIMTNSKPLYISLICEIEFKFWHSNLSTSES